MRARSPAARFRAHPCVGGENVRGSWRVRRWVGSSPRGRGKPPSPSWAQSAHRLIPAWAGKTEMGGIEPPARRAHPRVGGENLKTPWFQCSRWGSSPRGRGKRDPSAEGRIIRGLIPAWAGKTFGDRRQDRNGGAHPRVGGENADGSCVFHGGGGSSPRGRGKQQRCGSTSAATRLIPAWAGKTRAKAPCASAVWAHPRVGGENRGATANTISDQGSSPRGRGKRRGKGRERRRRRLIPAWAGKTWTSGGGVPTGVGSSPRGRGKPFGADAHHDFSRLIPAWAGKTLGLASTGRSGWAHPRVGGENWTPTFARRRAAGSSPRGRGKRPARSCTGATRRLIPAWAGKTKR